MKSWLRWLCVPLMLSLVACSTPPKKSEMGTVLGGVGGGVLGAQIGGGTGRTAAIIAGTIIGAVIGHEIGQSIDRTDELKAQQVLEVNRSGQTTQWVNPDSGNTVAVTPIKTYQVASGEYCREYQTEVIVGGKKESAYGTACRQPDGSWKIQQ
ncbi:MAG: glycine zipper 2TM domain-containing protein [Proteobacteria bacterium]|nr:glycine zipper 2TM domain-containing protein [Pseudomonadota bacterium]